MLGVVGEILCVKRCQRDAVNKAAGGDPAVVDWPRAAAELGVGLQLAPLGCDRLIEGEQYDLLAPARQVGQTARSLVAENGPLRQFAEGHEGDAKGVPGQPGTERIGQAAAEDG